MRRRTVESFHSSEQPVTRRHRRRQPDVFRVQRFIITVLKLSNRQKKEDHETRRFLLI